jgi:hypothetical protein
MAPLSIRISGTVKQVAVNDYEPVKAGQLLVQLDDDDYPVPPDLGVATHSNAPAAASIHRKISSINEWTLSIQQEIAKRTVWQIAYFGTRGTRLFSSLTLNWIDPAGFSTMGYQNSSGDAYTHALQTSIQRSFSTGWMLSANYEWSHSIDDGSLGGGEADTPQNSNCIPCERASSDQDMRSYFTASTIYQLPFGRGRQFGQYFPAH